MKMYKLTPKQAAFCQEYIVDLNATQAAIRAGYSAKSAYSSGQRMLKNVEIAQEIERLKAERAERTAMTADEVLLRLKRLATADITDVAEITSDQSVIIKPLSEWPPRARAAVREIKINKDGETTIKLVDPVRATIALGKHLGIFENKQETDRQEMAKQLVEASRKMFATVPTTSIVDASPDEIAEIEAMTDDEVEAELKRWENEISKAGP